MEVPDGIANLGIRVQNLGADVAKQQLVDVGVAGDAAASKVSQAFARTQTDTQRLAGQLNTLSQITNQWSASGDAARSIAASLAAALQEEGAMAGATAAQVEQLAAAQAQMVSGAKQITDSTRQMTLTQMQAIQMNDSLGSSMGVASFQAGRLRQDLGTMLGRLTGTSPIIDRFAGSLGAMALGSGVVIAVMAGIAAMIGGWDLLSRSLRGVTADQDKAIDSAMKAKQLKDAGGSSGVLDTGLANNIAADKARVDELQRQLTAQGTVSVNGGAVLSANSGQNAIATTKQLLDALIALQKDTDTQENAERQKAALTRQESFATNLADLSKFNLASDAQRTQALKLEQDYFTAARELAAAGQTKVALEYQKMAESIKTALSRDANGATTPATQTEAAEKQIAQLAATALWQTTNTALTYKLATAEAFLKEIEAERTKGLEEMAIAGAIAMRQSEIMENGIETAPAGGSIPLQTGMMIGSNNFQSQADGLVARGEASRVKTANDAFAVQDAAFRAQQLKAWTDYYTDLAKTAAQIQTNMLREVQRDFSTFFDTVLSGGVNSFGKLWQEVKAGFDKLTSDMLASGTMQKLAQSFPDVFGGGKGTSAGASVGASSGFDLFGLAGAATAVLPIVGAVAVISTVVSNLNAMSAAAHAATVAFNAVSVGTSTFITSQYEQTLPQNQQSVDSINTQFGSQLTTLMQGLNADLANQKISGYGYVFNQQGHGNEGKTLQEGDVTDPTQLPRLIALLQQAQGTGVNVAADRALKQTLADLTSLNSQYQKTVALAQQQFQTAQADENTSLKVRLLQAQGNTVQAAALALQLQQTQEYAAAVAAGYDASTLALLTQVQAQEKLTAATNGANAASLNMVSGYKVQAAIFAAMASHSPSSAIGPAFPTAPPSASAPGTSGDLTVNVKLGDGSTLGTVVLKDFKKRAYNRFGDTTRWSEVQA